MGILIQTAGNPFDAVKMSAFGQQHANTLQFIENQYNAVSGTLDAASQSFINASKAIYERVSSSEAIRNMKAAVNRVQSIFQSGEIRQLDSLAEIQNAHINLQRLLMAQPTLRNLYHKQGCDGYSDTYIDMNPGMVGHNHYEYQMVNDGIVTFNEDGSWESNTYLIDYHTGDSELDHTQQLDMIANWDTIENELRYGTSDPTDKYNREL